MFFFYIKFSYFPQNQTTKLNKRVN